MVTCVAVIEGSTNGSDAKFDAMNCLLLLSFDVFWAVSVSIMMVVFFVSQMISLSDSVWFPFLTCVLFLSSICVLCFNVSGVVVYFLSLFISVCVVMSLLILIFSGVVFLEKLISVVGLLCVVGFALFQLEIHLMLWSLVNTLSPWRSSPPFFFDYFVNLYIFFFC